MAQGKSCGRVIVWARHHKSEKPMPMEESTEGTWAISGGIARPHEPLLDTGPTYASHFSTCPKADEWRRP